MWSDAYHQTVQTGTMPVVQSVQRVEVPLQRSLDVHSVQLDILPGLTLSGPELRSTVVVSAVDSCVELYPASGTTSDRLLYLRVRGLRRAEVLCTVCSIYSRERTVDM